MLAWQKPGNVLWLVVVVLVALVVVSPTEALQYEWVEVDYDWASCPDGTRETYIASGRFVPHNNAITGVKVWRDTVFVTVPRWRTGVPGTLNKLVPGPNSSTAVLRPFPSWELNQPLNYSALQYVQSMEIDQQGWMWIIDAGRLYFFDRNATAISGPPKLVIWDLNAGALVREFVFPNDVAPYDQSFLNDIVVDPVHQFAYISEANTAGNGAIVIYDFKRNLARRWAGQSTLADPSVIITVNGKDYPQFQTPEDGIALVPSEGLLYYCALEGIHLYSLPTALLMDFTQPDGAIELAVVDHGVKPGPSDGLAADNQGRLYLSTLNKNAVYRWDTKQPLSAATLLAQSDTGLIWVDTFGFRDGGYLVYTSNKLQDFFTYTMDFSGAQGPNFRILDSFVNASSYVYPPA